ncbi:MAG: hypothetical protein KatS3mg110_2022 [Pirellulaceae bacterium]|nr:MAG: hypothetical protein KatS3mg110_2022 [Pirellulaceae bacterium]
MTDAVGYASDRDVGFLTQKVPSAVMTSPSQSVTAGRPQVDLRNPVLAAILAWLWPGAGHLYQRRYAKGWIFMAAILVTYFWGLFMGGGHVVYASFSKEDRRWQYFCQLGVGLPALPALVQTYRVFKLNKPPLFGDFMAPPHPVIPNFDDQLAEWHRTYHQFFELGTLYTMVAGLLNILAIYDAYAGPFIHQPSRAKKKEEDGQATTELEERTERERAKS